MEQIIVKHLDGSTTRLQSKTNMNTITKANQSVELLNKDIVDITIVSANKLSFKIGDKITIVGRDYTMNIPATEHKLSEHNFEYTLQFEGVQYDLGRVTFDVNIDTTGSDLLGDSLTGDLKMFLDILMLNIARVFPGKWSLGTYPANTETKTLTFSESDNCLSVLQMLCDNYKTEFDIAIQVNGNRVLNIGEAGRDFTFTFEYGKGKGLYELTREKVSSSNIVNRLKVFGSSKNITTKYRAPRLCLPGKTKAQSYIEDAASIAAFGVWESAKIWDDIFPHRKGTITALGANVYSFVDSAMNFDLNEKEADGVTTKYLMNGTPAKIHFNTGALAGYEFEINSYNHSTKTFTLVKFTDERDMTFPSESSAAFQLAVGDEYVILDIALPQSYIDEAESKLSTESTAYLNDNCQPKVQYSLAVHSDFLKTIVGADTNSNIFWVGDYIPIKDSDLEVDKTIRVKGFDRDLLKDFSYNLQISDMSVSRTVYNRVISELRDLDKVIKINRLNDPARARRSYLNALEILNMIFDPEGNYYTDKIKPLSIDTTMLSVGAKSMQFGLSNTMFEPNYGGNKNRVVYKGGVLSHYTILDGSNNPRIWNITDGDIILSTDANAYYIYAKCQRTGSGAVMLFSTDKITAEQDANWYHFLLGVINSVDAATSTRAMSLMYGFTTINGRYITTGRISSADGNTYFDLDNNEIQGVIKFLTGSSGLNSMTEFQELSDNVAALDYIKNAILNGSTTVAGGLILANLLMLKGSDNVVRAGLSGLVDDNIFLFADTSNAYAKALQGTAMFILRKDGTSKLGIMKIDADKVGLYKNGIEMMQIRTGTVPNRNDLISTIDITKIIPGGIYSNSGYISGNFGNSESIIVTSPLSSFTLKTTGSMTLTVSNDLNTPILGSQIACSFVLEKYISEAWIQDRIITSEFIYRETPGVSEETFVIDSILNLEVGTYRMRIEYVINTSSPNDVCTIQASASMRAQGAQANKAILFGDNGLARVKNGTNYSIMSDESFEHRISDDIYMILDQSGLKVKGPVDMPGLKGSGSVSSLGILTNAYGIIQSVSRSQQGIYSISHNIGHSNYTVCLTVYNSNAKLHAVVTSKSNNNFIVNIADSTNNYLMDSGFELSVFSNS